MEDLSKNNEPNEEALSDVSDVPSRDERGAPVARWLRDIQRDEKRKVRGQQAKSKINPIVNTEEELLVDDLGSTPAKKAHFD